MGEEMPSPLDPFRLDVSPAAALALRALLDARPPGLAVRAFVITGTDPRPSLVLDRPLPHEELLTFGKLPFLVDALSRRYLAEATIDLGSESGRSGFRITGPNLGGSRAPGASAGADGRTRPTDPAGGRAGHDDGRAAPILASLRRIFDPEVPMNIVDLGLIYGVEFGAEGLVRIRMTTTSPGCPVAGLLHDQVKAAAEAVAGVRRAEVELVTSPPWGPHRMSEFARRQFGYA